MARAKPTERRAWIGALLLGILIFITTWIMQTRICAPGGRTPFFWPTSGVMVAVLLVIRNRNVPPFVASAFLATTIALRSTGMPAYLAIAYALINAIEYTLLTAITHRWFKGRHFLARGRNTCGFMAGSAAASAMAATLFTLLVRSITPNTDTLQLWILWFSAIALGHMLVTPFAIATADAWHDKNAPHKATHLATEGLLLAAMALLMAGGIFLLKMHQMAYLPFPILLWAVYRFNVPGATAFSLFFACLGIATMRATATLNPAGLQDVLWAQGYLGTVTMTGLILAALRIEWQRDREGLATAEERYRLAIDAVDDAVWDWDVKLGSCVFSNRWYTMLGYDPQAFTANFERWMALIHPDDRDKAIEVTTRHSRDGTPFNMEYRLLKQDGTYRWVQSRGRCVERDHDGTPRRILGTHTDISERRRLATELHRQAERLHLALAGGELGVWDIDLACKVITLDDRYSKRINSRPDVQMPLSEIFSRIHPDDRPIVEQRFQHHTSGVTAFYEAEYRIQWSRSEPWQWVYSRGLIVSRDNDGRALRMVGTNQDISARRHLEEQLLRSQKMDAIGQLAGGIAHDFNNLLHVILGYGEMLSDELESNESMHGMVGQILGAGQRAQALVAQLLSFSRRGHVMRNDTLDINAIITDFQKMVSRVIGQHININIDLTPDIPHITGDRGQIEQVLMNLCVNACDAMPDGGALTMQTTIRKVANPIRDDAVSSHYVSITISDTGCGMDEELQQRIFDPFFTTKDVGKGTGLGLSTAYAILQRHKGFIDVKSAPGRGTLFRIFFPIAAEQALVNTPAPDDPSDLIKGRGETILLAEDEEMVRNLCAEILKRAGYTLIITHDGAEALRLFENAPDKIHLLILDMMLPGLPGWKVAEKIREIRPDMPILYCSGHEHNSQRTKDIPLLRKPYRPHEIIAMVNGLITNRS